MKKKKLREFSKLFQIKLFPFEFCIKKNKIKIDENILFQFSPFFETFECEKFSVKNNRKVN